jgi:hypothetical protein
MENDNSEIFFRLLSLKKEGYIYITSCDTYDYTGYDQAVADSYEYGDGTEPNYGDWIRETVAVSLPLVNKYVTFHDNLLIYGKLPSRSDYEAESVGLDYDEEKMIRIYPAFFGRPAYYLSYGERTLQEDIDVRYVDLVAYSIWTMDFENANQEIESYEKLIQITERPNLDYQIGGYFGCREYVEYGGEDWEPIRYVYAFVKAELWNDVTFVEKIIDKFNFNNWTFGSFHSSSIFLSESFKINNDSFFIQYFPEDLSIYMLLPDKYPTEMRNALEKNGNLFKKLPEELKSNKELALLATKGGASLALFNSDLQNDPEIIALVKK